MFFGITLVLCFAIPWQILSLVLYDDTVVQDDFRQSCFWLWQWWDKDLLINDFYTDMYSSHIIRTPLLHLIYKLAPFFTDNLIYFSKIFVLMISMLSSLYVYLFFYSLTNNQSLPVKTKSTKDTNTYKQNSEQNNATDLIYKSYLALVFTVAMTVTFWCTDHVSAAQARSFVWLGIFAYMYYKQEKKDFVAAAVCFISLLLSPITFLLCLGMEFFHLLKNLFKNHSVSSLRSFFDFLRKSKEFISLSINSIITVCLYGIVFKDVQTQGVGTAFTLPELKALPEFNPGGRHPIFGSSIWDGSWWVNEHWGLGIGYLPISKIIPIALLLIVVFLITLSFLHSNRLYGVQLSQILVSAPAMLFYSSVSLYFAAQILFPLLYLPSRYIAVPSLLLSVTVIVLLLNYFLNLVFDNLSDIKFFKNEKIKKLSVNSLLIFSAFFYWSYFKNHYHPRFVSLDPAVKQVIEQLPKNSLIAAHPLLPDISTISVICKRSVFADYERAMAYTKESLAEIRRRNVVSLQMTYTGSREELKQLMLENAVTHFLAHAYFYSPQYLSNPHYIEPYNQFLRDLIAKQQLNFFLKKFLEDKKNTYMLVSVRDL